MTKLNQLIDAYIHNKLALHREVLATTDIVSDAELGTRARSHHKWGWQPGMLLMVPTRPSWRMRLITEHWGAQPQSNASTQPGDPPEIAEPPADAIPDFSDPATLGCLAALISALWGECAVAVHRSGRGKEPAWEITDAQGPRGTVDFGAYASRVEALVVALEAVS